MKHRWIIVIGLLLVASGCDRISPPPPSFIDALVSSFKPGEPVGVGQRAFTADKIVRIDQFTVEYHNVKWTTVNSDGEVLSSHARSVVCRFFPPDEIHVIVHDAEMRGPGLMVTTAKENDLGRTKISLPRPSR